MGEAAGEGEAGQAGVAHAIRNRLQAGGYGDSPAEIVTAPRQFTPWETRTGELLGYKPDSPAYQNVGGIVDRVWKGDLPDNTGGATHFANEAASDPVNQRGWIAEGKRKGFVRIGNHIFMSPDSAPGRRAPSLDDFEGEPAAGAGAPVDIRSPAQRAGEEKLRPATASVEPTKPAAAASLSLDDFEAAPSAAPSGPKPSILTDAAAAERLRAGLQAKADERLVGPPTAKGGAVTGLMEAANTAALGIPLNIATGIETAAGKLGVPGYADRSFADRYQQARDELAALNRQHPVAGWGGFGAGIIGGALALPGLKAAEGAGLAGRAITSAATGGLYGGLGSAIETHDPNAVPAAVTFGAVGGAALTSVLEKVGSALANSKLGRAALSRWTEQPQSLVQPNGQLTEEATQILRGIGLPDEAIPAVSATMQKAFAEKGASPEVAREALLGHFGITGSQGQIKQDFGQQRFENLAATGAHGPEVQQTAKQFFMGAPEYGIPGQAGEVAAAKAALGERLGGGVGIDRPLGAGEMIADRARTVADQARQAEAAALRQGVGALQGVRGGQPPIDATAAGEEAAAGIRQAAAQSKAGYQASYEAAGQAPGTFAPNSFNTLGKGVAQGLQARGVEIDPQLTPAAQRGLNMLGAVPPAERTMKDVEQLRKRLVANYQLAKSNPTDARAARAVIGEFEDQVERRMDGGLFSGDEGALAAYKEARAKFAQHRQTFASPDDVGRMMQRIVERNAQPGEVANFLYGSASLPGNNGRAERAAEHVRGVLGADSPAWKGVQQGLISRVLGNDADPAKMAGRVEAVLNGPGRNLAGKVLDAGQVDGLRSFQKAIQTARSSRTAIPEWVQGLGKRGFSPQAVIDEALGQATPGGRATSARFVEGLRGYFGDGSPELNALRQAGWQKATTKPEGVTDFGPKAAAEQIGKFLDSELSRSLSYTPAQRGEMGAFAQALRTVAPMQILGKSAHPNSDTASTLLGAMGERIANHRDKILGMLGSYVAGPLGVPVAQGLGAALSSKTTNARQLRRATEAFSPLPVPPPAPLEINVTPRLGTAAGLIANEGR